MPQREVVPGEGPPNETLQGADALSLGARRELADSLGRDERHRRFSPSPKLSPDAIVVVDAGGLVREWNPAAESMLQTTSRQAGHTSLRVLLSTSHRKGFEVAWLQLLEGNPVPRVKTPSGMAAGSAPALDVTVAPIRFGEALAGAVVILRDQTAQGAIAGAALPEVAAVGARSPIEHDGSAELPGRHLLRRRLSTPTASGHERSVAVFDIDAFSVMVATYGPDAADAVLTEFAEVLKSLGTPGAFAHWQADSFVWIVDTADPVGALDELVSRLTKALEEPFLVDVDRVWLTLSVGLATSTLLVGGDLLAAANDALQSAKRSGGRAPSTTTSRWRLARRLAPGWPTTSTTRSRMMSSDCIANPSWGSRQMRLWTSRPL